MMDLSFVMNLHEANKEDNKDVIRNNINIDVQKMDETLKLLDSEEKKVNHVMIDSENLKKSVQSIIDYELKLIISFLNDFDDKLLHTVVKLYKFKKYFDTNLSQYVLKTNSVLTIDLMDFFSTHALKDYVPIDTSIKLNLDFVSDVKTDKSISVRCKKQLFEEPILEHQNVDLIEDQILDYALKMNNSFLLEDNNKYNLNKLLLENNGYYVNMAKEIIEQLRTNVMSYIDIELSPEKFFVINKQYSMLFLERINKFRSYFGKNSIALKNMDENHEYDLMIDNFRQLVDLSFEREFISENIIFEDILPDEIILRNKSLTIERLVGVHFKLLLLSGNTVNILNDDIKEFYAIVNFGYCNLDGRDKNMIYKYGYNINHVYYK